MEALRQLIDLFLHLDRHLAEAVGSLGNWFYVLLFGIVFCETGLVITPFLPGDSLLFAVGALAAIEGSPLSIGVSIAVLLVAAILGDAVNYQIGLRLGPAIFKSERSRWLNKKHLERTQAFYEKYGAKTIVLARFVPIVRTFAPFVAGVGRMPYRRFALYNVAGAVVWVLLFTLAGYYFGQLPLVRDHFHTVIVAIIVLSLVPPIIEIWRARRAKG